MLRLTGNSPRGSTMLFRNLDLDTRHGCIPSPYSLPHGLPAINFKVVKHVRNHKRSSTLSSVLVFAGQHKNLYLCNISLAIIYLPGNRTLYLKSPA
ncbi:hypothetical protein WN943_020212 [Citrus x changshan-huyou]